MPHPFEQELQIAIAAVAQASILCRNVQTSDAFDSLSKDDKSPVTVADFGSQAIVCRAIREAFPTDPVIGEEDADVLREADQASVAQRVVTEVHQVLPGTTQAEILDWIDIGGARDAAPRTWTLDPIDGTKGFLRKGQYAVALGLLIDGVIEVGAMACPNLKAPNSDLTGWIFSAVRGQGAKAQAIDDPSVCFDISVTENENSADACFCESVESGHSNHSQSAMIAKTLGISKESVRLDSQAKYACVARGEADIYLRLPTRVGYQEKIWDHAAGVLVIEEAGGKVTDIHGKPLDFTLGSTLANNQGVVASNGKFHDQVIAAVQASMQQS
ncbi:MAG: 3'(2'),5'-bisphosphate nucleotidase [Blastopirellula sp.]|nr:MAG: 3'(2'),5'-bisphosphate nucleotidase [Blastopirellula sp.]